LLKSISTIVGSKLDWYISVISSDQLFDLMSRIVLYYYMKTRMSAGVFL